MQRHVIIRLIIIILGLFGTYASFGISEAHMSGVEDCPTIGFIPACYVVLLGYFSMVLSVIRPTKYLFLVGWLPVFLLASIGVSAEILSETPVCPRSNNGIPQCYFSFAMSAIIGVMGLIFFNRKISL